MDPDRALADQLSLYLIDADLDFCRSLFLSTRLDPIRSVAGLALMPFVSTFLVESSSFLEKFDPTVSNYHRQHQFLLRASRLRLKLLDDKKRSREQILGEAEALARQNSNWFKQTHRGPLRVLKQLFQCDLGLFLIEAKIICTTHGAFISLGLDSKALPAEARSAEALGPYYRIISEDYGRYVGTLLNWYGIDDPRSGLTEGGTPPVMKYRDVRSEDLYEAMAGLHPQDYFGPCILLTLVLSQVNTARMLVPAIAGKNEVAALKLKFVTIYHAAAALDSLLARHRLRPYLRADDSVSIQIAISHPAVKRIRRNRGLRNTFVHYAIDSRAVANLSAKSLLFGVVEAHSPSWSIEQLQEDVDAGLESVAQSLEALIPEKFTANCRNMTD